MELILHWITQYGYFGIFSLLVLGIVGLPIPDETLLTFAGYLVYRGQLQAVPTLAAAFLGSACGITLSYTLGRVTGYFVIEKYGPKLHIHMDRVHQIHDWFHRLGGFTLTFGYFVPGVRHLTAYVAGASELEYPAFAGFAYSGGLIWSVTFISLGYLLGDRWDRASGEIGRASCRERV
jgi:membrane protein DedA with SNARE-associated domain